VISSRYVEQESRAVARKLHDATVIFDSCVSNMINTGPWQTDVKLSYLLT